MQTKSECGALFFLSGGAAPLGQHVKGTRKPGQSEGVPALLEFPFRTSLTALPAVARHLSVLSISVFT